MADAKITDLNELTTVADGDLLAIVDDPTGSAETKKITRGNLFANTDAFGLVPIGGVIAVFADMAGCPAPSTTYGWAKCNGTTPASQGVGSPTIAGTMPNINAGAFIRGATASWTSGSATGGSDTHTHTMGNHTHTISNHAHSNSGTTSAGSAHNHTATTGAGSAHSHTSGTLKFYTFIINSAQFYGYDASGNSDLALIYTRNYEDNASGVYAYIPNIQQQYYTGTGSGSTDTENAHTHTTTTANESSHTHTYTTNTGNNTSNPASGTPSSNTSDSGSTLPAYFSAVYYMRVK